ncbi:hypothetical protein V8V91_08485 [Algoriphagus halophilus]|uniref:hypothetical protein n=1 Tax=Algoriphagus halophilus TaxID=226505 RepID=UPI00358F2BBB
MDLFTQELGWIQEFSTHFPIKSYRLGNKTFHAPAEALADIDVERLMEADVALYRFIHSQKNHYLGHFLAMLYTVKGEVLTDGVIDTNAALLSKIPAHEAIAHIRSFIGSFTQLRKVCSTLFPNDFDSAQSDGSKSHPERSRGAGDPSRAWQKMLFELSNTPGYPGMHLAKQARAWEALPYFDAEQLKISQQIDRLKNTGTK